MKGLWFIDDIDIYDEFRVGIEKGGYNDLFRVPSLKSPESNEWHENDGIEIDLEAPKLQNKQLSIKFSAVQHELVNNFIAMLSEPGYRNLYIPSLGKTWQLRLSSEVNNQMWRKGQKHEFSFYDDNPRRFIAYSQPAGHGMQLQQSFYSIDGIRLDQYGIVTEESRANIFKMPVIRPNLESDILVVDGKIVSTQTANMRPKNVALKLCFYCNDINTFWQNYSAFFYNITKPGERIFYIKEAEEEIPCYYESTSDFQFARDGEKVILKFTLNLTFIVFRIRETDYLLAAEDYSLIVLEDSQTFIDMEVY